MKATLGGGCFWCFEAAYQLIEGVTKVVPGYAGGQTPNPTYYEVCEGTTGHAEVVQITFDESIITYETILDIFWVIHDPTTPNRQGNDVGTQYRSVLFAHDKSQLAAAKLSKDNAQELWDNPIVTEIKPLDVFYEAEQEHHNYFINHPEEAYCQVVINPKLQKLRLKFAGRLKQ